MFEKQMFGKVMFDKLYILQGDRSLGLVRARWREAPPSELRLKKF